MKAFTEIFACWLHVDQKRQVISMFGPDLWFQFNPAGVVTGYSRSRSALELVDADHFEGLAIIESLAGCSMDPAHPPIGCPDPTDPAAEWIPSPIMPPGGFPVSATRIHRVPPE